MKLYCEVDIKDKTPLTILDAIAYASRHEELWKIRKTRSEKREEMMSKTDLRGKCGSCIYFQPEKWYDGEPSCYGKCLKGRAYRQRTVKACKKYERKTDE